MLIAGERLSADQRLLDKIKQLSCSSEQIIKFRAESILKNGANT